MVLSGDLFIRSDMWLYRQGKNGHENQRLEDVASNGDAWQVRRFDSCGYPVVERSCGFDFPASTQALPV